MDATTKRSMRTRARGKLAALFATCVACAPSAASAERSRAPSHDLGAGLHTLRFRTEDRDVYSIHAASVVYDYWAGRRFGVMVHSQVFFPCRGAQPGSGENYRGSLRDLYSQRWGLDGTAMVGMQHPLANRISLFTGVGVHLQSMRVNGAQYSTVELVTLGVGAEARMRYELTPNLHVGGLVAGAIDPIDLIAHRNRAVVLFPVTFAATFGARFGSAS